MILNQENIASVITSCNTNITRNIIHYRTLNGFSQNDLATYLNISRQAISKWERGICLPDIENIIILVRLYNISLDNFIFLENP